ncbi:MAG TPA: 1-deoxy-D-xylulose-5-phosphate reductoisomerase [Steroidobacteraceae bacterium]|nr:1-deoxy-D-xylulose-5-phosphate reductoisomerase [Steroidobacteraceae bacterium]
MTRPLGVAVLGSTGSIGESTLDVLRRHPDRYRALALLARRNVQQLVEQAREFRPDYAAIADPGLAEELRTQLQRQGLATRVLAGPDAASALAVLPEVQCVVAAIVGVAGLPSTLAAAGAGKRLLIANKEALVVAGPLVLAAARRSGAVIIPVDSEHNAIFQCLPAAGCLGEPPPGVRRILLTASGGPFRDWSAAALENVTPEQACAHPVWNMGRKISVDSATLMNKGLELIEAVQLFGLPPERIEVVIHRQSVVHSLVEYVDGSMLAQLGSPDMRTPIAHALAWPERIASGVQFLDLLRVARLDFEAPDTGRFPCLRLGMEAARAGGDMPAVLNGANEVAVGAFLAGRLDFGGIAETCAGVMNNWGNVGSAQELTAILAADERARALAAEAIGRLAARA